MKKSTRKSVGVIMLGISAIAALVFYHNGFSFLTFQELRTDYFPGGGSATCGDIKIHWPTVVVSNAALLGLVAFFWPEQKPPRLKS